VASAESRGAVLTYLGVAGWQVRAGGRNLLVDPYVSRVDTNDEDAPVVSDESTIARVVPRDVDVVLVTHSHFDHLLDVPSIARRSGAEVVGTESSSHVLHAAGIPDARAIVVQGGERRTFGPFTVRVFRGLHALIGVPNRSIPAGVTLPMSIHAYGEGNTLDYLVEAGGHSILFIGSANFIEEELTGLRPDVAVVAVGRREKIPDYTCRLMRALGKPPLVLANHFDAFNEPLGPKQMDIDPDSLAKLRAFVGEVHACAPESEVRVPEHFASIALR